jgi:hypothetical protein
MKRGLKKKKKNFFIVNTEISGSKQSNKIVFNVLRSGNQNRGTSNVYNALFHLNPSVSSSTSASVFRIAVGRRKQKESGTESGFNGG